jgi:hypothetical protein
MNASKFTSLPAREKKKIVQSAIQGANKDQMDLMKRYQREFGTKEYKSDSK